MPCHVNQFLKDIIHADINQRSRGLMTFVLQTTLCVPLYESKLDKCSLQEIPFTNNLIEPIQNFSTSQRHLALVRNPGSSFRLRQDPCPVAREVRSWDLFFFIWFGISIWNMPMSSMHPPVLAPKLVLLGLHCYHYGTESHGVIKIIRLLISTSHKSHLKLLQRSACVLFCLKVLLEMYQFLARNPK